MQWAAKLTSPSFDSLSPSPPPPTPSPAPLPGGVEPPLERPFNSASQKYENVPRKKGGPSNYSLEWTDRWMSVMVKLSSPSLLSPVFVTFSALLVT